jgi:hypothetical protein
VHTRQCAQPSFIIFGEAAKTRGPAEMALHYPPARQQHEAYFAPGRLTLRVAFIVGASCLGRSPASP